MAEFPGSPGSLPGLPNPPVAVRYPSWMDAPYLASVTDTDADQVVTLTANVVQRIRGSAMRFGIGFGARIGNAQPVLLSPHNRPDLDPFLSLAAGTAQWMALSQFGPFVTFEWYAVSTANGSLRVYAVELR